MVTMASLKVTDLPEREGEKTSIGPISTLVPPMKTLLELMVTPPVGPIVYKPLVIREATLRLCAVMLL